MTEKQLQYIAEINRSFSEQIKTADQKAAYIFTFVLALMVWSAETRRAFNAQHLMEANVAVQVVSIALSLSILIALLSAVCVILPRSRPGRTILFWGAWPEAGDRLLDSLARGDMDELARDYLLNTRTLANICAAKYRMVFLAFRSLIVTVCSYAVLLVLL